MDSTGRTFTAPLEEVEKGTLEALRIMGFPVKEMENTPAGLRLLAQSANETIRLEIQIDLEPLSSQTTRMQVVAKRDFFRKDAATATEIIQQTAKILLTLRPITEQGSK